LAVNPTPEPDVLHNGKHLQLLSRNGWEYVHRPHCTGIVGMIAVTDEGKLLLVEQFRPPVGKPVIELPAGLVGDVEGEQDESLADAAKRELLEETGYEAADMTRVMDGVPSAGICDEVITLFRATRLTRTGDGGGDASESITVHEVPVADLRPWLAARAASGIAVDFKLYAALHFLP